MINSLFITPVEWTYLNTDMRKFEASQKEESRAQSADSSKAYRKPSRAFNCSLFACFLLCQPGKNRMQLNYRVKRCGVKNQNRRQKVLNRGLKFSQGVLTFWTFDEIFTDLWCFIFKFGRAELTNAYLGDWAGLKYRLCYHYWNTFKEIKSYNHQIK